MREHWRAFGPAFFHRHQGLLLWMLNAPVIGWWSRRVLRISGRQRIDRILPHAIFWADGENRTGEFRTHWKYAKRLYHAFRPLWWMLHAWDLCFADRWIPRLSFGFSTLTKYPDAHTESTSVDGWVRHVIADPGGTWAALQGGAGTEADDVGVTGNAVNIYSWTEAWARIRRSIFLFDTSALTTNATISAAVMSIYGSDKGDEGAGITPDINVYTSAPASNTALAAGDFDSLGTTAQCDTVISYGSYSIAGYNDFTLNSTGRGNVSKTGVTKFGCRNANYDAANVEPYFEGTTNHHLSCYFADQTGTTNDPKLVVTYTLPGTGQVIFISKKDLLLGAFGFISGAIVRNPKVTRRGLFGLRGNRHEK